MSAPPLDSPIFKVISTTNALVPLSPTSPVYLHRVTNLRLFSRSYRFLPCTRHVPPLAALPPSASRPSAVLRTLPSLLHRIYSYLPHRLEASPPRLPSISQPSSSTVRMMRRALLRPRVEGTVREVILEGGRLAPSSSDLVFLARLGGPSFSPSHEGLGYLLAHTLPAAGSPGPPLPSVRQRQLKSPQVEKKLGGERWSLESRRLHRLLV